MAEWTHAICATCWNRRAPEREPARLDDPDLETCCFCGMPTKSGIYVRHNPADPALRCKGVHPGDN